MEEKWKNIKGYKGLYKVSNLGQVKSMGRKTIMKDGVHRDYSEKILKQGKNNRGYCKLELYNEYSEKRTHLVHRLVAEAFIPNPDNKEQVNHKNGIKHDNVVTNLEWMNQEENMLHAYTNGIRKPAKYEHSEEAKIKMKEKRVGKTPFIKKVNQIDPITNEILNTFKSTREAADFVGCHETSISEVCRKKKGRLTTKGFKWEYI